MKDEEENKSNANKGSYEKQSSMSASSRKGDEELLESLKMIDEGNGLQFYQTEIKRFETVNYGKEGQVLPSLPKGQDVNQTGQTAPNSMTPLVRKKSSNTHSKRYLQTVNQGFVVDRANVLIKQRKLCRLFTLIGIYVILFGVILFFYFFGSMKDKVAKNLENKDITVNLQNCRLFIKHCDSCSDASFNLDFRSSVNKIFTQVLKQKPYSYTESSGQFNYSVNHFDDIKGCNLEMVVPSQLAVQSLRVKCDQNCVVIQRDAEFSTKTLRIDGDSVSVNMAKLNVGNLLVNISAGYFQVNNLILASDSSYMRTIFLGKGDVILQSTSSMVADFVTSSENYCFSGNSTSVQTAVAKAEIQLPLKDYQTQAHLQKGLFSNQWQGKYGICNSKGCSASDPTVSIYNFDGNIYINVLEVIPSMVHGTSAIVKGSRYGNKVEIPEDARENILKLLSITFQSSLPNLIIKFAFGNTEGWSAHGSYWVYTDHSLYSVIKPWWMSFFTIGSLVGNKNDVATFLSPGFCPYRHTSSIIDNVELDTAIKRNINGTTGVLNFLKPANQELVPDPQKPSDGFANFATFAQFSDEWVQVHTLPGQNYQYKPILLTENIDTFLLIVASIVVTFLVAARMTYILVRLLFRSFQAVRERLYHMEFYWKIYSKVSSSANKSGLAYNIEEEENDLIHNASLKYVNINLTKSFFDLPSTTAFVDYLIVELWTSKSESLRRFYKIAFEEADHEKIIDYEMQNMQRDRVPLKQLKSLYQQLCFLMGYKEDELSSSESINLLNKKGMVLTNTDSHRQYLIRLTIKTMSDFSLSFLKNDKKQNSLQIFFERFCQHTNFDEDKIAFDDFVDHYTRFCKLNHMEPVLIDHILLRNEFGIESRTYLKEMVEREKDFDQFYVREEQLKGGLFGRLKRAIMNMFSKRAFYNLKVDRVKNVNLFLAGKLNESDVGKEEYNNIISLAILEDGWYFNDIRAVLLELVINSLLSVPFISIFIFQEIEHSSYSLRDESINIYGFNLGSNDIWLLPQKISRNTLVLVMLILFVFFWVSCLFNMVVNMLRLEYPWLRAFDPNRTTRLTFDRILNAYQWWFIISSFICMLWYLLLVVVWWILASIMKGQAYLVSTISGVTFIVLVHTLRFEFMKIAWDSQRKNLSIFRDLWNLRIQIIVKKMIKYIAERNGTVVEQIQSGVKTNQLVSHEENLKIIELNLAKVVEENPKCKNFLELFYSLIHRDSKLRAHLETFLEDPPFGFNRYMTQLLCNILFMSKSIKLDRFSIEKNIKLCASVIFYYQDNIELVPLTLSDLGPLRKCDCNANTVVTIDFECSNCGSEAYRDPEIKREIRHLRINDNARIMVYMLDILSNLQKRRSDQVIKIIEKTFLESFTDKVFDPLKPTFDLIHFIVFNLVEDYDFVKLTQIFTDFMKKSLKVDMNQTEILMLYLLKDNLILSNEKGQVYDYQNIASIYKRQICTNGEYSSEKKMLVNYLSLSTCFLAGEPQISEELVQEFTTEINSLLKNVLWLPYKIVEHMIHMPLYFTQSSHIISKKIAEHAVNCNIPADISNLIYCFSKISHSITSWKVNFEILLRKSQAFLMIKRKLDMSFKELFGIIYMMKGDTNNDCFDRTISLVLKKDNLLAMKKQLDNLIALYASKNRTKIKTALLQFKKFCTKGEAQFAYLCKIFSHFKGIIDDDEQLRLCFDTFYNMLPSKRTESDSKLKSIFLECIGNKNFSKYKTFKENMIYSAKNKNASKLATEEELLSLLNLVELFFELNFGTDIKEIVRKYKEFVPEMEANSMFNVSVKLLKTINGFKISNQSITNDRLKDSFNLLAEIMYGRPNDFENLWTLIYCTDHSAKLSALNYFLDTGKSSVGIEDYRFRHHVIYIDKRVSFIKQQANFITDFCKYNKKHQSYQFGMLIIKRMFIRNSVLSKEEINLLLSSIIAKKNRSAKRFTDLQSSNKMQANKVDSDEDTPHIFDDKNFKRLESFKQLKTAKTFVEMENTKVTRFYSALMDFIVNQNGELLGNYFLDEHDEPMLKTLALCRHSNSTNDIINRIFEQLVKNGHIKLCSLLYFYYIVIGLIQKRKINLRAVLDQEISSWVNIKPEFLEFIELYTDRKHTNLVDTIYKIQNRIIFNMYSDKEIQKIAGTLENVLTRDFYQNIELIIKGEQHALAYLADLFKVPLKKLRFIYILTKLKTGNKLVTVQEQFTSNQEIIKILEMQSINPQELIFLLKICMNEIDYDSITDLLRLMKLDQVIIPEILINLLLLDVKVERKPITIKEFNKNLLVHSAIFDRIKQKKEICWAFCRVLKGDFLLFTELLDLMNIDQRPQNHKLFSRISTGLIGVKNHIHSDSKTLQAIMTYGVNGYKNLINSHFQKYKKGDFKECSLEFAQYLLYSSSQSFKLHPFWEGICTIFNDQHIADNATTDLKQIKRLGFFKEANVMHFIAIYNLVNIEEPVLEFIYDFAFFRNVLEVIRSIRSNSVADTKSLQDEISSLLEYFEKLVFRYRQIMKGLIREKKIVFDYERFARKTCPVFQGFLMDTCKTDTLTQSSEYYLYLNTNVFQAWKQDLHKRRNLHNQTKYEKDKIDKLTKKIEELFREMNLVNDPFKMFVTQESAITKEYWETQFTEIEYLDDYLDSLTDYFMKTLDEVDAIFNHYSLVKDNDVNDYAPTETANYAQNPDDEEIEQELDDDDASSTQEELMARQMANHAHNDMKDETAKDKDNFTVKWSGLAVYSLLHRLRKYQQLSSEDKVEKNQEIIYKSNILFGIIEKSLYFYHMGESFSKYSYMSEFNLSIGIRMPSKAWAKYAASLFMPELYFYTIDNHSKISSNMTRAGEIGKEYNPEMLLAKCISIRKVYENDQNHFVNKGVFAQFLYTPPSKRSVDAGSSVVGNFINLFTPKLDQGDIAELRKRSINKFESNQTLFEGYYTLQFVANREYKDISSDNRTKKIQSILIECAKEGRSSEIDADPTLISLKLISIDYYNIFSHDSHAKQAEIERIKSLYFPKYSSGKSAQASDSKRRDKGTGTRDHIGSRVNSNVKIDQLHINFLNDMALGKYSVLSETKNIFTDDIDLATYQKIYESILHLHSSKRMFNRETLMNSLKTLSSYLSSNVYNLNLVLEFVVEPTPADDTNRQEDLGGSLEQVKNRDYFLFRELGLKNQSFFHIFLMHGYPNHVRTYMYELFTQHFEDHRRPRHHRDRQTEAHDDALDQSVLPGAFRPRLALHQGRVRLASQRNSRRRRNPALRRRASRSRGLPPQVQRFAVEFRDAGGRREPDIVDLQQDQQQHQQEEVRQAGQEVLRDLRGDGQGQRQQTELRLRAGQHLQQLLARHHRQEQKAVPRQVRSKPR